MIDEYVLFYNKIKMWFEKDKKRVIIFKLFYRGLPLLMAGCFCLLVIWLFVNLDVQKLKFVHVPAIVYLLLSALRVMINRTRPYAAGIGIEPVINKNRQGKSFPSRHTFSAAIIAVTFLHFKFFVGIFFVVLSLIVGITRILAGVHYPSDVLGGLVLGYGVTELLYFMLMR